MSKNSFQKNLEKSLNEVFKMTIVERKLLVNSLNGRVETSIGLPDRLRLELKSFMEMKYSNRSVQDSPHPVFNYPSFGLTAPHNNESPSELEYFFEVKRMRVGNTRRVSIGEVKVLKELAENNENLLKNLFYIIFHWEHLNNLDYLIRSVSVRSFEEAIGFNKSKTQILTNGARDKFLLGNQNLSFEECLKHVKNFSTITKEGQ